MKHIKTFRLYENSDKNSDSMSKSVYSTDEMTEFVNMLAGTVEWDKDTTVMVPSGRNISAPCHSGEDLLSAWDKALKYFKNDKDIVWYIWDAKVGGSFNKPKALPDGRYEPAAISAVLTKYPNALKTVSIGVTSKDQVDFDAAMSRGDFGSLD